MQTLDQYNPLMSWAGIFQGKPGCGKTTLACQFPGAYILDLDLNLSGPIRYLKEKGLALPVGFDTIDYDDGGNTVDPKQRYTRIKKVLNEVVKNDNVRTIVIDGLSKLSDIMVDEVKRQNSKDTMTIQMWGDFLYLFKNFITWTRCQKRLVILTAHTKLEKDELSGAVEYGIHIPGQFAEQIGGYVSDIWHFKVDERPDGQTRKHFWEFITLPNNKITAKNSLSLKPVMASSFKDIEPLLMKYAPVAAPKDAVA